MMQAAELHCCHAKKLSYALHKKAFLHVVQVFRE